MTQHERDRLVVLKKTLKKHIKQSQAAAELGISARQVRRLLQGLRAKVNLIALNPGPDIPFHTPSDERVHAFQQILIGAGVPTFVRRPRGRDIYAACGQLKRTVA